MKTTRHLLTLFLLMCSISLWAQFGGGPGGGFGSGRPPGGGRSGERPGQTENPNRQLLADDAETSKTSGPKIGSITGTITDENNVPFEYATIAVIDAKTQKVITGSISNIKGKFNIISLDKIQSRNDWQQKVECSGISIKEASDFRVEDDGICEKIDENTWQVTNPLKIRLIK